MAERRISDATRAEEEREAGAAHAADRAPTDEEAAAAPTEPGAGVSDHEKDMAQRGAAQRGEGRVP